MSSSKDMTAMDVDPVTSETSKVSVMETNENEKSVMASGTAGSVSCSLHPLVIMNVSEHWTRERAQDSNVQRGKTCGGEASGKHNLKSVRP